MQTNAATCALWCGAARLSAGLGAWGISSELLTHLLCPVDRGPVDARGVVFEAEADCIYHVQSKCKSSKTCAAASLQTPARMVPRTGYLLSEEEENLGETVWVGWPLPLAGSKSWADGCRLLVHRDPADPARCDSAANG